jgi:Tol biopolymer transport system component
MITKRLRTLILSGVITTTSLLSYNVANAVPATKSVTKNVAIQKVQPVAIVKNTIDLDGKNFTIRQTVVQGKKVFCVSDLSYVFQAKYQWDAAKKTATLIKNGKTITFKEDSQLVNGILFYEIEKFATKIGIELPIETRNSKIYISTATLDGSNFDPQWIDSNNVLVAHGTDDGIAYYEVDVKTKKSVKVISESDNATQTVVSPNGKKIAYINDAGGVYVVELATKITTKVNPDTDTLIKVELQWSQNGDKLYFVQDADTSNIIVQLDIESKTLTTLLDDYGDKIKKFKSDLSVSADGTQMYFTISLSGTVKQDSTVSEDTDPDLVGNIGAVVDTNGTESQLYYYKVGTVDASGKAVTVKLTSTNDSKVFVDRLSDGFTDYQYGRFVYVSADLAKEDSTPILKLMSADGKLTKNLISDVNVLQSVVAPDGRLIILALDKTGNKGIYEVNQTTGVKQMICAVNDTVEQMFVSKDGKQLGASVSTQDGSKISILLNGELKDITK